MKLVNTYIYILGLLAAGWSFSGCSRDASSALPAPQPVAKAPAPPPPACLSEVDSTGGGHCQACQDLVLYKYLSRDTILQLKVNGDVLTLGRNCSSVDLEDTDAPVIATLLVYPKEIPEGKIRANSFCSNMHFFNAVDPAKWKAIGGKVILSLEKGTTFNEPTLAYARLEEPVFRHPEGKRRLRFRTQLFYRVPVEQG